MHTRLIVILAFALLAAGLGAATPATIELRNGGTLPPNGQAYGIESETLYGVAWLVRRGTPGTPRVEIWDLQNIRYTLQGMDEFNGMARKVTGGQGKKLQEDAKSYLDKPPAGLTPEELVRMQLACRYYLAVGLALQSNHEEAVAKFTEYLKEAESNTVVVLAKAKFRSPFSGKDIANAAGLHRLYLDGLKRLGLSYLALKDLQKANDLAFKPLQDLTSALATTGQKDYHEWTLEALRSLAAYAEGIKDYKSAREAYERLSATANLKAGGRPSRAGYEASLKVGYMQIREGEPAKAKSRFFEATNNWERAHSDDAVKSGQPPQNNWITPDIAYVTAGSYVGLGLVEQATAKSNADWASALTHFSTALSVFHSDDEIRSMALLGAANSASMLAEVNTSKADVAAIYAKLAEKYLMELTLQLPKSVAAHSESVPEIQKRFIKHKKD